ncbi:hypothetical protein SARC_09959 [Sphaeroforma arctica JP610]|uniref:Uncharacterized protein n=1 Tax=Sphaeroforma arctica JP610 TaxID=667725 RepID=A0A0L0FLD5_9EUKA|nr:hypothetical protein SARC_09959 [Sphaeroforma arctica JP610]KNC77584.1 hypothetical protein SARC_09959 [Sphaeroforma arctica JP610]|eukprot:XP_014151486.1 hypothetical protein SARC_09959 [Sphaeroforma arctica JP610]
MLSTASIYLCAVLLALGSSKVDAGLTSLHHQRVGSKVHRAYTRALPLKQGEVTNNFHTLPLPVGPIAVHGFRADVVEKNRNGEFVPVPISDAYLHHHVVGTNYHEDDGSTNYSPMKPKELHRAVGFGAGTESRKTMQAFEYPYAFVTEKGENKWAANVHIINTRGLGDRAHKCLECPCTEENDFRRPEAGNATTGPFGCNKQLLAEDNGACFREEYTGGLRCCENGLFCFEPEELEPEKYSAVYYLRYEIQYSEVTDEIKPLLLAGCCDATGDLQSVGNIEYDIQKCSAQEQAEGTCVHTLSTVQYLNMNGSSVFGAFRWHEDVDPDQEVDIVFMVGHQHRGGLGISMYDRDTDNIICASVPKYGQSEIVGDEKDYVVAMSTCSFDPPLRRKARDMVKITAMYDSTVGHRGVMSLFYIAISEVSRDTNEEETAYTTIANPEPKQISDARYIAGWNSYNSHMLHTHVAYSIPFICLALGGSVAIVALVVGRFKTPVIGSAASEYGPLVQDRMHMTTDIRR